MRLSSIYPVFVCVKIIKEKALNIVQGFGADEGIWTHTLLRELEPESSASASSATSAYSVVPVARATHIIIADAAVNVKRFYRKKYNFLQVFCKSALHQKIKF